MTLMLALLALLAPIVLGAAASAQSPPTIDEAATHALPTGIPGTLDPATGSFTPLAPEPLATDLTLENRIRVRLEFSFNPSIHADDSVFCTVTAEFGNLLSNNEFYPNHSTSVSVNFSAGIPDRFIYVPYTYTPNSSNIRVKIYVRCRAINSLNTTYSSADNSIPLELKNDFLWDANLYL